MFTALKIFEKYADGSRGKLKYTRLTDSTFKGYIALIKDFLLGAGDEFFGEFCEGTPWGIESADHHIVGKKAMFCMVMRDNTLAMFEGEANTPADLFTLESALAARPEIKAIIAVARDANFYYPIFIKQNKRIHAYSAWRKGKGIVVELLDVYEDANTSFFEEMKDDLTSEISNSLDMFLQSLPNRLK